MTEPGQAGLDDPAVHKLAGFFLEHPVWCDAARHVREGASSNVYFRHLPGQAFHLLRVRGRSELRRGAAPDPDFSFRFTPESVDRLAAVEGSLSDFGIALFELILESEEAARVDLRVVAPLWRLIRRGYVALLLAGGPALAAFGARHGVAGLVDLKRLIQRMRSAQPADWECID